MNTVDFRPGSGSAGRQNVDRVPPNDIEAERAIVAICLLTETAKAVRQHVQPSHFYLDAYRQIYTAILALEAEEKRPDLLTVRGYLADRDLLQRVGGLTGMADLLAVPTASNPREYCDRVVSKHMLRQAIDVARRIAAEGYGATDATSFLASAKKLFASIESPQESPIETISTAQLFEAQPPVPWVIPDVYLAPGRPALIAGYGYSAKSVSCQAMAVSVASGSALWGKYRIKRVGRVLHLDHEQGRRATTIRYQRLARAMGVSQFDLGDRLVVAPLPKRFRLSNPDAEDILEAAVQGFTLCIIDSLRATTPGVDENDSQIRECVDKLLRVSERTGCAFVLIHHAGKGGKEKDAREKSRGSSAIFDACGLVLQLDGKVQDDGSTIVQVQMTKAPADASGSALAPFTLRVRDVLDDEGADDRWGLACVVENVGGEEREGPAVRFQHLRDAVLACVRSNPNIAGAEAVRARLGGRAVDVRQAVRELLDEERIENIGTPARPRLRISSQGSED